MAAPQHFKVEKRLKSQFRKDGAVLFPSLIGEEWLSRLRDAIERDIKTPGPFYHGYNIEGGGRFHGNMRLWESDADFHAYCTESVLPSVAAELLDVETVLLYYDQLFVKEAATNAPTRWHNDQPYWPIRGWPIMSFWLALDPVTSESGALEFVKSSHAADSWYQPEPFAANGSNYDRNPDYLDMPDIDSHREDYEFLSWDMVPGDVIAFHALCIHGGPANKSHIRRRGYTVRYCGPDMTYYSGAGTSPMLADDDLSHGEVVKGPRYPVVWTNEKANQNL